MPGHEQSSRASFGDARRTRAARRLAGVSLIELAVVLGIVGALLLVAIPTMNDWFDNQRIKSAARDASDLLLLARSEAIRTGVSHVVFFGVDPDATMMTDPNGNFAPLLAVDESVTVNCRLDTNEKTEAVTAQANISWGVAHATTKVPSDTGGEALPAWSDPNDPSSAPASGSTFKDPNGSGQMDWVMFRPDGIPIGFDGDSGNCGNITAVGRGGGALYISNGARDYAIVVSPLGSVRVHVWQPNSNSWSS
jgi:Tfp pilus assembly protein FimT